MSTGGKFDEFTSNEIRVIETYLGGKPSTAYYKLKTLFNPVKVKSPSSPNGYYYVSYEVEKAYEYYRNRYPKFFIRQKLNNFEELKHRAISYCEDNGLL